MIRAGIVFVAAIGVIFFAGLEVELAYSSILGWDPNRTHGAQIGEYVMGTTAIVFMEFLIVLLAIAFWREA